MDIKASRAIDQITKEIFDFLISSGKYKLFVITVVFKSSGISHQEDKWLSYYKRNVLHKFRRILGSTKSKQDKSIPIDWIAQYELNERNYFGSNQSSRYPHHIHGIIPVPLELVPRIFNEETGEFSAKLVRDLDTTGLISSVDLQPYDETTGYAWLTYMLKGKHPDQYSWNK